MVVAPKFNKLDNLKPVLFNKAKSKHILLNFGVPGNAKDFTLDFV